VEAIGRDRQEPADNYVTFDPATLTRVEQYKLLTGAVIPRPIALVTTLGAEGVNAAPFSFFNAVAAEPPIIMFSAGRRSNGIKDTTRNIQDTREFVVHIVDDAAREKMNICGIEYDFGVDEVHEAGFRTAPSVRVRPPRLIDCPVQLECRAIDIITFGHYDMIIGEVVFFHFRADVINERMHTDAVKLNPVGRLSGTGYVSVTEQINMPRLPVPPGKVAATIAD